MSDSVQKYFEQTSTSDIQPIYSNKKDSYVQLVKAKFEQRSQTGIKKYNTTLEREDLNLQEWLNHLQEELMDATLYVERLKAELKI
jgi:hypothetical protein